MLEAALAAFEADERALGDGAGAAGVFLDERAQRFLVPFLAMLDVGHGVEGRRERRCGGGA